MRKLGAALSVFIMLIGIVTTCLGAKMEEISSGAGMPAYLVGAMAFVAGLALYTFWIYRMIKTGELR